MTPPAWWEGLAPVETAGPAGAPEHRLAWRDGDLHLLAHPDPDAERAMAALGGDVCACLATSDAWRAEHERGAILVTGARRPPGDETLDAPAAAVEALSADLARWRGALASLRDDARQAGDGDVLDRLASRRWPEAEAVERRLGGLLLLTLDAPLQHRLQASVAAAFAADPRRSAALTAATASRVVAVVRGLGWSHRTTDVVLGDDPSVGTDRLVLPRSWMAAVWGRGLGATPDGQLVLDVTSVTPEGTITVVAAGPGKARVEIRVDRWENA